MDTNLRAVFPLVIDNNEEATNIRMMIISDNAWQAYQRTVYTSSEQDKTFLSLLINNSWSQECKKWTVCVCLCNNLWRGLEQMISLRANEQLGLCVSEKEFMENNVVRFTRPVETKLREITSSINSPRMLMVTKWQVLHRNTCETHWFLFECLFLFPFLLSLVVF